MNVPTHPPIAKRTLVAVIVRRGQRVLVERLAPALRVVREDGQLPRIEAAEPPRGLVA